MVQISIFMKYICHPGRGALITQTLNLNMILLFIFSKNHSKPTDFIFWFLNLALGLNLESLVLLDILNFELKPTYYL